LYGNGAPPRGVTDVTIYEKGDAVGGTWRENTYPGLACDVPSRFYQYTFAPNPDWSHVFSPGAEIRDYFTKVAHDKGDGLHPVRHRRSCTPNAVATMAFPYLQR